MTTRGLYSEKWDAIMATNVSG